MTIKKKFLHICLTKSWGGLEMTVHKWNEILKNNGHQNFNVCSPHSPLSRNLKDHSLPVVEWGNTRYFSPKFTLKLRKYIREKQVDIILMQNLRDLWIVSPVLYGLSSVRLMAFAQMLVGVKKTDPLHQWVYSPLKNLFTLTQWQQTALKPYLPVPPEKYRTLPNFVDTSLFNPCHKSHDFRKSLGFKPEDFLMGVVGRIDRQKGQYELIQAFSQLAPQHPKTHLLIVGEPTLGEREQQIYYEKLMNQVNRSEWKSRIHFHGFEKNPHLLLSNLDLFVLPSHCETFGYVVVEAMASGTPVLATDSGGVPEILEHGELGELFQPKSISDLKKKLEGLLKNPEKQNEKTLKALKKARNFYDCQKVYERFIQIIN